MESPLSAPVENEQELLADGDNLGQQEKTSVTILLLSVLHNLNWLEIGA